MRNCGNGSRAASSTPATRSPSEARPLTPIPDLHGTDHAFAGGAAALPTAAGVSRVSSPRSGLSGPIPAFAPIFGIGLLLVLGLQLWLIHRVESALRGASASASTAARGNAPSDDGAPDPLLHMLARIESRLIALEARREPAAGNPAAASSPSLPPVLAGSPEAFAAERELAAMLPPQPMTMADLLALQGRIGALPAAQQQQLSAALARAVNSGRVSVRQE